MNRSSASKAITKADGTVETFKPEKLLESLLRSGASLEDAQSGGNGHHQ